MSGSCLHKLTRVFDQLGCQERQPKAKQHIYITPLQASHWIPHWAKIGGIGLADDPHRTNAHGSDALIALMCHSDIKLAVTMPTATRGHRPMLPGLMVIRPTNVPVRCIPKRFPSRRFDFEMGQCPTSDQRPWSEVAFEFLPRADMWDP
jgi:hypothetical protein